MSTEKLEGNISADHIPQAAPESAPLVLPAAPNGRQRFLSRVRIPAPLSVPASLDEYRKEADPVAIYFQEIGRANLLTHAEEVRLARAFERGRMAQLDLQRHNQDQAEQARLRERVEEGERAKQHLIEANLVW